MSIRQSHNSTARSRDMRLGVLLPHAENVEFRSGVRSISESVPARIAVARCTEHIPFY
jgi:hypothetical protein